MTHPFHPLFGRELEFIERRQCWRGDRGLLSRSRRSRHSSSVPGPGTRDCGSQLGPEADNRGDHIPSCIAQAGASDSGVRALSERTQRSRPRSVWDLVDGEPDLGDVCLGLGQHL
ncbi:DUF5372 family protein [Streptomyces sp. NPDC002845]